MCVDRSNMQINSLISEKHVLAKVVKSINSKILFFYQKKPFMQRLGLFTRQNSKYFPLQINNWIRSFMNI